MAWFQNPVALRIAVFLITRSTLLRLLLSCAKHEQVCIVAAQKQSQARHFAEATLAQLGTDHIPEQQGQNPAQPTAAPQHKCECFSHPVASYVITHEPI